MSELTRQVEALNKAHLSAKPVFVGRASLFFTSSDAARHDFQEVYEACMGAVRTLAQYDSRFEGYDEDILHPNSISAQRELKTKEENKEIDKRIKSLLKLLALYATEKSSHLILEYLLQRYRINELNMEALLTNMISIHDTKIFAKLVMLIPQQDLKSSNWAFLGEVSRSGVPLDRAQLVKRLVVANNRGGMGNSSTKGVDTTLLQALCSHVQTALKTAGKSGMPSESRAVQVSLRFKGPFFYTVGSDALPSYSIISFHYHYHITNQHTDIHPLTFSTHKHLFTCAHVRTGSGSYPLLFHSHLTRATSSPLQQFKFNRLR